MTKKYASLRISEDAHGRLKAIASLEGLKLSDYVDDVSKKLAEEKLRSQELRRKLNDGFF